MHQALLRAGFNTEPAEHAAPEVHDVAARKPSILFFILINFHGDAVDGTDFLANPAAVASFFALLVSKLLQSTSPARRYFYLLFGILDGNRPYKEILKCYAHALEYRPGIFEYFYHFVTRIQTAIMRMLKNESGSRNFQPKSIRRSTLNLGKVHLNHIRRKTIR